ncbi:hypothetical protein [Psychroserpens algicola]|uniref:DUF3997 domain-containing protein n=1 Tax=Psychroserpens algicola TaxID=1719034 RepID=A0ABT0HD52_9FLAO|nr:hypothetical protein [Psychroserpens algicola]MCK8482300.1 hypothetical protein [Psychroserpens algicola]
MRNQVKTKNNLNKSLLFLFFISLIFSCKTENSNSTEIKKGFHNVEAIGELISGSYTFCGIVPTEINYTYRTGKWKFITSDNIKIAEGEYDVLVKENDSSGGCGFKYFENKVDSEKWNFWNKDGEVIEPIKRLINIIESKQVKHSVYLE